MKMEPLAVKDDFTAHSILAGQGGMEAGKSRKVLAPVRGTSHMDFVPESVGILGHAERG